VQAHGGGIRAIARAGGGSIFQFTLPIGEPPQVEGEFP